MVNSIIDTKALILLSMFDQIVMDDLLQEKELKLFEEKKKWHDLWRQVTIEAGSAKEGEEGLLDWGRLKEQVIIWLKSSEANGIRESILEQCCSFEPYSPLPGWKVREPDKIRVSPQARELSLEKICRLLGLEQNCQELFPS